MYLLGVTHVNWEGVASLCGKQTISVRNHQGLTAELALVSKKIDADKLVSMTVAFLIESCDDALLLLSHFTVQAAVGLYICTGDIKCFVDFTISVMLEPDKHSQYMLQEANALFAALLRFNRSYFDEYRTAQKGSLKYLVRVK